MNPATVGISVEDSDAHERGRRLRVVHHVPGVEEVPRTAFMFTPPPLSM